MGYFVVVYNLVGKRSTTSIHHHRLFMTPTPKYSLFEKIKKRIIYNESKIDTFKYTHDIYNNCISIVMDEDVCVCAWE